MNRILLLSAVAIVGLAGCTANIPYRDGSYAGDRSCGRCTSVSSQRGDRRRTSSTAF